eukprot:2327938-Pyramimonas_sp.AAC.1
MDGYPRRPRAAQIPGPPLSLAQGAGVLGRRGAGPRQAAQAGGGGGFFDVAAASLRTAGVAFKSSP